MKAIKDITAEEFLKEALLEFNDNEENPDKYIAVYQRTIKAMQDFANIKCERQKEICAEELEKNEVKSVNYSEVLLNNIILNSHKPKI